MQNKANLLDTQMNVSFIITRDYEKKTNRTFGENKPKQSQSFDWIRQAHHKSAQDRTKPISNQKTEDG